MPGGRPSDYTPQLAKEICDTIASCAKGIKRLCAENSHWPVQSTVYKWLFEHPEFSELYTKAKKRQVEVLVDEIIEISDDTSRDVIIKEDRDGNDYEVCNTEFVNRSRLRVDSRKWISARLAPKIYGDNAALKELAEEIDQLRKLLGEKNGNSDKQAAQENS